MKKEEEEGRAVFSRGFYLSFFEPQVSPTE